MRDGTSSHDVGVPDDLLLRLDTDGVAMQDIVTAGIEFVITREWRTGLLEEIDLGQVAEEDPPFLDEVPAHAKELAATPAPPRDETVDSDERLVREVEQEQVDGQASRPDPTDWRHRAAGASALDGDAHPSDRLGEDGG